MFSKVQKWGAVSIVLIALMAAQSCRTPYHHSAFAEKKYKIRKNKPHSQVYFNRGSIFDK